MGPVTVEKDVLQAGWTAGERQSADGGANKHEAGNSTEFARLVRM